MMVAVPRLYEKMEDKIRIGLQDKPKIMKWALEVRFKSLRYFNFGN
jgi:long-subunit acyl-CoA synthetase (AMP-forming)